MRNKMKNLLMIFAICMAFSVPSFAAPEIKQKPVQCATPLEVINEYVVPNNLKAMFIAVANVRTQYGDIVPAPIVFFYNPTSGRYMLMEGTAEETCVIELGMSVDFNVDHDDIISRYLQNSM